MIHKVEYLTSIGKFRSYQAAGPVNFHKMTLIYADNGSGKTTLSSILRSLSANNPNIVRSRVSTNSTIPQAVQIVQRPSSGGDIFHTFGASGWTTPLSDLEIFDIHFVNENIYSGFDFNDDHKKSLHQFVIGAQGIAIQQQIEQNKADKAALRLSIHTLEQQLVNEVGHNLQTTDVNSFILLNPATEQNLNENIQSAETALAAAQSSTAIRQLPTLSKISSINLAIDFATLKTDIQSTSQTIQDEALKNTFNTHCQNLKTKNLQRSEGWIREGFSYTKKQIQDSQALDCPYCSQQIPDSITVTQAYIALFDEAFNSLVGRLEGYQDLFGNFNFDAIFMFITTAMEANATRTTSWSSHILNTQAVFNLGTYEELRNSFREIFNSAAEKISEKKQNPSAAVNSDFCDEFSNKLQQIKDHILHYNQCVDIYNADIANFLSAIPTVTNAQTAVDKFRRIQKKLTANISDVCTQITAAKQNLRNLEGAYTTLITQQASITSTFFTNYKDRINYYLDTIFRTPFKIVTMENVAPAGRSTQSKVGYKLSIDNKDISFDSTQPLSVKDCLSEGDKNTIAFAFFLSKLDLDANKANKILVFDDPLSSLDSNRRGYTIRIIKSLMQEMKQVVVLSHNEFFLSDVSENVSASDIKTLRIHQNFATSSSSIVTCDLDELVKHDYYKKIEQLNTFRANPEINQKDAILSSLRNVLESHIKFKFYAQLRTLAGQKTFGNLIRHLESSSITFRNTNRNLVLSKLKAIGDISWKPHHGDPNPDYTQLGMNPNTISLTELDNFVVDTLNLITTDL